MLEFEQERKKILEIRRMISHIETALDQLKEYAYDLEEEIFDIVDQRMAK